VDSGMWSDLARNLVIARSEPPIVNLELIVTESCNMACGYCFEFKKEHGVAMPFGVGCAGVDFLIEHSRHRKELALNFVGGEPLVEYDLICNLVDYACTQGSLSGKRLSFALTTNGTLLTDRMAKWLALQNVRMLLSVDRGGENEDRQFAGGGSSWSKIQASLKLLKKYQGWVGARMTVTPGNARDLALGIAELHELGVNQFIIGFETHGFWSEGSLLELHAGLCAAREYYKTMLARGHGGRLRIGLLDSAINASDGGCHVEGRSESGRFGCGAGWSRIAVDVEGRLHGCSKLAWGRKSGRLSAPHVLGTLFSGIDAEGSRQLLMDRRLAVRGKCGSCTLRLRCQGGCYASNDDATADIYEPSDDYCKLMFLLDQFFHCSADLKELLPTGE
jgi:uncharacterized protein